MLTLLKYPYPKDVDEPATYDTVRVHAEWGKNRSSLDQLGADQSELSVSFGLVCQILKLFARILSPWHRQK